jgi:hypothetical protein
MSPDPIDSPDPSQIQAAADEPVASPPPGDGVAPCVQKKHWVEVRMIDETDKPVPGLKCRLRDSADAIHKGALNNKGICRFDGLPEGDAYVCFPELDQLAWSRV